MRKIFLAALFVIALTVTQTCAAKDVWVEHWNSENVDIYVMDDTITSGSSGNYFSVSTKMVTNGQLKQVVVWKFSKFRSSMWRYETSTMDGSHTTVVMPRNMVFEFSMNKLGWSYTTDGHYYY